MRTSSRKQRRNILKESLFFSACLWALVVFLSIFCFSTSRPNCNSLLVSFFPSFHRPERQKQTSQHLYHFLPWWFLFLKVEVSFLSQLVMDAHECWKTGQRYEAYVKVRSYQFPMWLTIFVPLFPINLDYFCTKLCLRWFILFAFRRRQRVY